MNTAAAETVPPGLVRSGRVVSADGTPITYLMRGAGPVLLAVHGGLGSAVSMLPPAVHLAGHYTVVAVNCRGDGTSGAPRSGPDIAHEVANITAVIDSVGPVEVLFGCSFGAVLALETALRAPERVRRPKLCSRIRRGGHRGAADIRPPHGGQPVADEAAAQLTDRDHHRDYWISPSTTAPRTTAGLPRKPDPVATKTAAITAPAPAAVTIGEDRRRATAKKQMTAAAAAVISVRARTPWGVGTAGAAIPAPAYPAATTPATIAASPSWATR
ncbi:alpha/beta fold hydrolase [Nocardia fusca]|uniref:alpha/beta fold hydrolase n=1 Tax=Nocardia fusca TaxID=941183 RepID=UPI0037CA8C56